MNTLEQQMMQLKLSGMKEHWHQQHQQSHLYQELSFEERLQALFTYEIQARQQRRIERLIKQAGFRLRADVSQLDYSHHRQLDKAQVRSLMEGEWMRHHRPCLITGATGCGKTFLACALGHHYCRQNTPVFYYRLKSLLEKMRQAYADGSIRKLNHKLHHVPCLIIDDWGLESLTTEQRSDLLELIDARYDNHSTMIISQLPIKHWYEMIGESTHADAILDRLIHSAIKVELKGESMRKKQKTLTDADHSI